MSRCQRATHQGPLISQQMHCHVITFRFFFALNPRRPAVVPDELRELVLNHNLQWTAPNWTKLFSSILATASPLLHTSALHQFQSFCHSSGTQLPFPVNEQTLCQFVAFLGQQSLKHHTIKTYLSGVRFWQIQSGLGDPSPCPD